MSAPADDHDTAVPARGAARPRYRALAIILGLCLAAIACIWLLLDVVRSYAVAYTGVTLGITLVALLVWIAVGSAWSRRTRCVCLAAIIVPLAVAGVLLRVETVTGDLIPRLSWRFARKPHERLTRPAVEAVAPETLVDLRPGMPYDWPEYMGPRRDSTLRGIRLKRDWEAHPPREVWRQPIGAGWSSFAVVGDFAVTQEQRGPQELVTCYELETGKLRWSYADDVYYESKIAGDGPRATPTIDNNRVYTLGSTGLLNCLEGSTGTRVWQRDVFQDTSPTNAEWGKASSPLVLDGLVIVTGGAGRGPTLVAYSAESGELVWKANDQPTARASYGSPMVVELAGVRQIVMLNDNTVCGYDPGTGRQLWEHPWPGSEPKVTQPVVVSEDRLLVGSGYGVGCALLQIVREGNQLKAKELWANRNLEPKFTNLIVHEGYIYGLDEGIFACLDLETGKRKWKKGRYGHGQIVLVDDTILIQAENGDIALLDPTPEAWREIARVPALNDKTWGHPVVVPPYLLVRNDREAACYRLEFEP